MLFLVHILPFHSFLSILSQRVQPSLGLALQWRQTDGQDEAAKAGWDFGDGQSRGPHGLSSEVAGERWPPREGAQAQVCAHGDLRLTGEPKGRHQQKHHLHRLPSPCKPEGTGQQPAPSLLLVGVPTSRPSQQVPGVGPTQEGRTSQCRYRAEDPKTVWVQGRIRSVPAAPRPEHCPESGQSKAKRAWSRDTREEQSFSRSSGGDRGATQELGCDWGST